MPEDLPLPTNLLSQAQLDAFRDHQYSLIANGDKITIHLQPSKANCPNCLWDHVKKRSRNIYDSSNSNTLGALHKPFANGQICPVCNGQGILKTPRRTVYTGLVKWSLSQDELMQFGTKHNTTVKIAMHIGAHDDLTQTVGMTLYGKNYELLSPPFKVGLKDKIIVETFWGTND